MAPYNVNANNKSVPISGNPMRILPILLLLAGCSVADLKGDYHAGNMDEIEGNRRILHAEQNCAVLGLAIGTSQYDKCLDDELKEEPVVKAQLDRLRADFARRAADGTLYADSQCEAFGYYRGTAEYNICLEYARENNLGGATKVKASR